MKKRTQEEEKDLLDRYRCLEAFHPRLVAYFVNVQGLSLQEARDVADECIEQAYIVIARNEIMKLRNRSAWLWGVAYCEAMAMRREAGTHPLRVVDPARLDNRIYKDGEDGEGREELRQIVEAALKRLPRLHEGLLRYCDMAGNSQRKASRVFKRPISTIRGKLKEARELLRAELEKSSAFRARRATTI